MTESILQRSKRIIKKEGASGLIKRAWNICIVKLDPLRIIFYPYAKLVLPKEAKKLFTAETGVDLVLNRFGGFIRPSQVKWEITNLAKIVEELKPKNILEIGTSKGGTLFLWARLSSKNAKILSIDLPGGENNWAYPHWKEPLYRTFATAGQTIELLREDSHQEKTVAAIQKLLAGEKLDFLFIDGDHSYEGVKKDYELYASFVRNGGVIAFHDIAEHPAITGCYVSIFWNEIKNGKQSQEFIENKEQGWAGIGVLYM
jgi:predicted O-methyltransferase YrrM